MQDLIKVEERKIGEESIQSINARELHSFLEVKSEFRNWIKSRISQFEFEEGVDFIKVELDAGLKLSEMGGGIDQISRGRKTPALESTGYRSNGQQGRVEYAITLGMAKELSMVENNVKGKMARKYFIECERISKNAVANPFLTMSRTQLLEYALGETRKVEQLESVVYEQNEVLEEKDSVIKEQQPKVEFYNDVAVAENAQPVGEVAKVLGTGQRKLFKWLRDGGYLMSTGTLPYQRFINSGLFEVKETKWSDDFGRVRINCQTLITGKGLIHIQKRFRDIASNDDDMVAFG